MKKGQLLFNSGWSLLYGHLNDLQTSYKKDINNLYSAYSSVLVFQ